MIGTEHRARTRRRGIARGSRLRRASRRTREGRFRGWTEDRTRKPRREPRPARRDHAVPDEPSHRWRSTRGPQTRSTRGARRPGEEARPAGGVEDVRSGRRGVSSEGTRRRVGRGDAGPQRSGLTRGPRRTGHSSARHSTRLIMRTASASIFAPGRCARACGRALQSPETTVRVEAFEA